MTDDQITTLRADIDYIKSLAQEGRKAPLLGGAILVLAGAVFSAASVFHWAVETGVLVLPPVAYSAVWLAAGLIFLVGLIALSARAGRAPGAMAAANRASGAAWASIGGAIFTLSIALGIVAWRFGEPTLVMGLFPSLIVALYGTGWLVSGDMAGKGWIKLLGFAAFAMAVALAFLAGTPELYLGYAAALVLLALVPGLVLMRGEPSDVI